MWSLTSIVYHYGSNLDTDIGNGTYIHIQFMSKQMQVTRQHTITHYNALCKKTKGSERRKIMKKKHSTTNLQQLQ